MNFFDFVVFKRPRRAIEWCDFDWKVMDPIRQCCQDMLTQQWLRKMPFVQTQPPAHVAAVLLEPAISQVAGNKDTPTDKSPSTHGLAVIDFCAGGGGPTPYFEQTINRIRESKGTPSLKFVLSDLWPNTKAWRSLCKSSKYLHYVNEPVDATKPPPRPSNSESSNANSLSLTKLGFQPIRIFSIFNLSFHHFDDDMARQILKAHMENYDGMAIVELQDRRLGCLLMMLGNYFTSWLVTWKWFPPFYTKNTKSVSRLKQNIKQLALTYVPVPVPILPPFLWLPLWILPTVLWWDGIASCLRTREFEEVMRLVGEAREPAVRPHIQIEGNAKMCTIADWKFTYQRVLHTWPFGYVNCITGIRAVEGGDDVGAGKPVLDEKSLFDDPPLKPLTKISDVRN